jgi:hypothetical protein
MWKEIIKPRVGTNKIEIEKTMQRSNERESLFFENISSKV